MTDAAATSPADDDRTPDHDGPHGAAEPPYRDTDDEPSGRAEHAGEAEGAGDVSTGHGEAGDADTGAVDSEAVDSEAVETGDVRAAAVDTGDRDAGDADTGSVGAGDVRAAAVDAGGEAGGEEPDDRLDVAEPERRLVARIVDTLAVGVPVTTVGTALMPGPGGTLAAGVLIAFALAYFCYELPQLALWGRTLGKRVAGIRVVAADGHGPVPLTRLLLRVGMYAGPPALRPVPGLGLLAAVFWLADNGWILRDPFRRAVHDRVAGTLVVRAETPIGSDQP